MSKSTLKILPSLMVAITAGYLIQPVFGNEIVITENSSTSLTVTYSNGSVSVNLNANDEWFVEFPDSVSFNSKPFLTVWTEPDNSGKVNAIGAPSEFAFDVFSDVTNPGGFTEVTDGTTVMDVGFDSSNEGTINMTFFDKGDGATVPDTGTTASLFGLSLMGLAFLRRLRHSNLGH